MVKSDEHMGKVKANLLTQKSNIEKREKARQMRHQKKFAKDVQRYVRRDFRYYFSEPIRSTLKIRKTVLI